jgi:hypothetical protein
MSASTYSLRPDDKLLLHGRKLPTLLHDHNELSHTDIEALVASGDCLVTLATALDQTTEFIKTEPEAVRLQTERVISTLLYMQRHYKLVRKTSDHTQ